MIRRGEGVLVAVVGCLAAFVAAQAMREQVPASAPSRTYLVSAGAPAALAADSDDVRRAKQSRRATAVVAPVEPVDSTAYLGDLLLARDSILTRWPDRTLIPLRIWVQPRSPIPDWNPIFISEVRSAFAEWSAAGVPLKFLFHDDSAGAEVRVTWLDRYDEPVSGKTVWSHDNGWWITEATIGLAIHHSDGVLLDEESVRALAMHEIGHALGLDHTSDTTSIMSARVHVRALSPSDRATLRRLYQLPPGSVR